MSRSGWVYVLTNASLPGLVKIGYTRKSAEKRCKTLNQRENPTPDRTPFELVHTEAFEDCIDAERGVHFLLDEFRFFEFGSELFRVSVDDVKLTLCKLKKLGTGGWKPKSNTDVFATRPSMFTSVSRKVKRLRNPSLYEWLVANYEQVKAVIGDARNPDDLEFSRARWMWVESLPADYKGKMSTPLGLMMEWNRVRKEVETKEKFSDRPLKWEMRPAVILSQTEE